SRYRRRVLCRLLVVNQSEKALSRRRLLARPRSAGYLLARAYDARKIIMVCRMSVRLLVHWPHRFLPACDLIRLLFPLIALALLKIRACPHQTTTTNKEAKDPIKPQMAKAFSDVLVRMYGTTPLFSQCLG